MSPCFLVTGGAGFIGSHLVDELIKQGNDVVVVDNLISGYRDNVNPGAVFYNNDISDFQKLGKIFENHYFDGIFHLAAISRTVWCIDDPIMAYKCNVTGTLNILEYSRIKKIKRIVLASSSIVYAFMTPFRTSKEALEGLADTYNKMYSVSTISLRFSNVYGPRQSETGPALNVFASFKKSIKENGFTTGLGALG